MSIAQAYEQSIELVERFAQCLLTDCKNKNDLASVKQLVSYVAYFNNEIEKTKIRDKIYENFLNIIESASEKPDCDTILKQFNEEIHETNKKAKNGEKSKKYISFMKMISQQNLADGDDDVNGEVRAVCETLNTIDPITKLPIVEPVKNKICGHTYEKTSILQLLEQNPRTKCPIAGCITAGCVRKSDLIPDNALKRMLTNYNFNSQKKVKLYE